VGRNVALFDLCRHWAYRARLRYTDRTEWEEVVYAYAWDRNLALIGDEFTRGPLAAGEVKHLARSVARWVWRNFTTEQFLAIQRARAKKGGQAKRTITDELREANRRRALGTRTITDELREANRRRATKVDRTLAAAVLL
jgi:hypothetical protein